ncbi:TPA: LPS export ABC transporter ATP-binding protein [candidate division WOR-3 bacterium]|jgi:lipopolysaccharide export system ATP-binding protein|uniref:LPS export ABC transporter ATP-binding protein n=1 Tax=candidate division WOR-3 bacterium TaxID=2052148 RepID=A0A350H834_UNCW3|nr:LPS export ABC transporter ATP-binding protein [candidate division WOR-3 bacterium]
MKLRSENIVKTYSKRIVADKVSVSVDTGKVVGLLGPNGAGKTTSFYMIVGMIKCDSGKIFLDETDITQLPMYKRARLGVGYLPQEPSIFRRLTVEQNLDAILEMHLKKKSEIKERRDFLLEKLKVTHIRKSEGGKLSGGERRRVEIARALTTNPKFLLLDEPFTGIDPKVKEDIQVIIRQLASDGIGILITDHNVRETLEITDIAHIIYEGRILLSGTAEELINDKQAREIYLGEKFRL